MYSKMNSAVTNLYDSVALVQDMQIIIICNCHAVWMVIG